jgi:quinolinate synthase
MTTVATAPSDVRALQARIRELARERRAVLLAHNYQRPEIQDIADFVGDSLGLSREAARTDAEVIVFCGVHFMAETAAILSPEKTVLIPDPAAGCSLSDTVTVEQLMQWKAEHPEAVVVSYVNTSAAVKAESDYCCTSGNAVEIVNSIPPDKEILFLPDFFLGAHVRRVTGRRNMHLWMGECHVHAGITPQSLARQRELHPDAEVLVHPECGCATNVLEALSAGAIAAGDVHILSTEGMVQEPARSPKREFIVATETGILYRLQRANPDKRFYPASDRAECQYMKMITLPKVLRTLERMEHRVSVPADVAERARLALDRMVAVGGSRPQAPFVGFDPGE